ncbi:MAG: hypothetical protein RL514_3150 [Verrucomicrobiota bacterium]|jgi:PAS domain S-box-containing protein
MNTPSPSEDPAARRRAVPTPDTELWHRDPLTSRAYLTAEWKALLGYEDHELGSDFNEFQSRLHPEEREGILRLLHANANRPDFQLPMGFRLRHRDGTYRWMPAPAGAKANQPKPRRPASDPVALRHAAEAHLKEKPASRPVKTETDLRRLQHEIEVQQIELEMQNEELRAARDQTAEDLERYTELYDFAPVGYFTFTPEGTVRAVNLLGATLLGIERGRLMGRNFREFVAEADQRVFQEFLVRVLAHEVKQSCEVRLVREGAVLRVSQMEGLSSPDRQECRAVLVDITEQKEQVASLFEATRFAQATIDALSAHLCVMGEDGTILATNAAWRHFAEANPPANHAGEIGANYFTVCERAANAGADDSQHFLAGLQAVLTGERKQFTHEYPCHSPREQRWFMARATRFPGSGPVRVVVAHENITERKQAQEARADTARFNEALLESSPLAILTYQASGQCVSANPASERIVGATREQLLAQNFRQLASWQRSGLLAVAEQALATGQPQEIESDFISSFGKELRLHCRLAPFQHASELHLLVCLSDIRERKLAEERLSEERELGEAILNHMPGAFYLISAGGQFLRWNKQLETATGYSAGEIARMHPADLVCAEHKERTNATFQQVFTAGSASVEVDLLTKAGERVPFLLTGAQVVLDGLACLAGSGLDITERKRAEASLRLQSAALNAAANEVVITNREGIIQWVNPAFTKTNGYTLEEAVGQNPRILKSGKHDHAFYKNLWATILRGEVWRGEIINRRKDASLFTEEAIITPVKDEHGAITHFIAIKQDITEKKLLEAKFLRAQRLEGLGALAGGVAHDLNNVLAPILMASDLLRSLSTDPQTQKLLEMIQTNSQRGAGMIRQILAFARGSAGEKIAMQVSHLLKEISKLMQQTFPPNIRCELRLASGLELVLGESTELYQVLLNLCVNARDAMPNGGTITLSAENVVLDETYARLSHEAPPGRYVVIMVADTGGGIPKEIQEKVFDPFFTTKEPGKGTGLGLATVKDIVAGHKGFIHLYSEVGVGTQFKIYLPAVPGEEATGDTTLLTLPTGHGELVLVVDDEAAVREIVKATLENYGYRVVTANDGTEGVARFFEHSKEVQLLVTDMQMPLMDGMALIRALRNVQPGLKVIAASGLSTHEAALKATGISVQAFIVKPFTVASLLLALDGALHPK